MRREDPGPGGVDVAATGGPLWCVRGETATKCIGGSLWASAAVTERVIKSGAPTRRHDLKANAIVFSEK